MTLPLSDAVSESGIETRQIFHRGAVDGVTGSCQQLTLDDGRAVLVDCGLFLGAEAGPDGAWAEQLEMGFAVAPIAALVVTHVHIDHVGRLPYLPAAGFRGPILCSAASAALLALALESIGAGGCALLVRPTSVDVVREPFRKTTASAMIGIGHRAPRDARCAGTAKTAA
ncbi:MBL fold metallo-hydrolase [Thiohalocapsa halophila]|uniref:MBL fold metallo-hydrolase n=1 Tax=Thiohalocapsa halophila TaxID=69359 RepID=UPI002ADD63F5|nr:MBL fold metallo-hydrolase [Thiohalocapsa halophila]